MSTLATAADAELQQRLAPILDLLLDGPQTIEVVAEVRGVKYRIRYRTGATAAPVMIAVLEPADAPVSLTELRLRFGLTQREAEVALLLAERRTNKEIARRLGFTTFTAQRHTERILAKLRVDSRRDVHEVIRR